jgi:ABC-type antimicrobial peptide transport system permease subunit
MEAMRVQLEAQMEFSGLNLGLALAGAVVMYVIVGLILSLIFRKSDPEAVY